KFIEVRIRPCVEINNFRGDWFLETRRPGIGAADQGNRLRLYDLGGKSLQGPTASKRSPCFEMGVREAPGGELVARPFIGALEIRRAGESRSDDVGQIAQGLHYFRMVQPFIA